MTDVERAADLEQSLSGVAVALFAPGTVDGVLQRVVDLAVDTVDGCDAAGIFVAHGKHVVTTSYSDPIAVELDRLQFDTDEGPCLEAGTAATTVYAADLADDERWPTFGPAATATGIRSVLAFPLSAHELSALNLYARLPAAFGATDRAKGLIFATLAGLALGSAQDREDEDKRLENLQRALRTRELIGQAQGILMERERITADQAFDVLRRASQHMNVKLQEIARRLVETGEAPSNSPPRPPDRHDRAHPRTPHRQG